MQHLKVLVSWLKVRAVFCFLFIVFYPLTGTLFCITTVKIIMDKISKRSKGYAFIEYTTEEAASAALKEMNGKVTRVDRLLSKTKHRFRRLLTLSLMSADNQWLDDSR